jgi:hypothetical protein
LPFLLLLSPPSLCVFLISLQVLFGFFPPFCRSSCLFVVLQRLRPSRRLVRCPSCCPARNPFHPACRPLLLVVIQLQPVAVQPAAVLSIAVQPVAPCCGSGLWGLRSSFFKTGSILPCLFRRQSSPPFFITGFPASLLRQPLCSSPAPALPRPCRCFGVFLLLCGSFVLSIVFCFLFCCYCIFCCFFYFLVFFVYFILVLFSCLAAVRCYGGLEWVLLCSCGY